MIFAALLVSSALSVDIKCEKTYVEYATYAYLLPNGDFATETPIHGIVYYTGGRSTADPMPDCIPNGGPNCTVSGIRGKVHGVLKSAREFVPKIGLFPENASYVFYATNIGYLYQEGTNNYYKVGRQTPIPVSKYGLGPVSNPYYYRYLFDAKGNLKYILFQDDNGATLQILNGKSTKEVSLKQSEAFALASTDGDVAYGARAERSSNQDRLVDETFYVPSWPNRKLSWKPGYFNNGVFKPFGTDLIKKSGAAAVVYLGKLGGIDLFACYREDSTISYYLKANGGYIELAKYCGMKDKLYSIMDLELGMGMILLSGTDVKGKGALYRFYAKS